MLSSRGIKPMESMAKGKSAKRLTLDPAFSGKPHNPDRADVQLICNPALYKDLQSFV